MARLVATSIMIACSSLAGFTCSCLRTGTACTWFNGTPLVIVGRVLVDSGEGWGERPARVQVEEALRGLSLDVREVEVNTMFGTSCYARLQKDERYIIYARTDPKRPGMFFAGGCEYLFKVAGNETLLDALRNAATGGPPRLVGQVRARSSRYGYSSGNPIAQARVAATSGDKRYEALSDGAGWFEMMNLAPGSYHVEASQAGYVFDDGNKEEVGVPAAGCEIRDLGMTPAGRISGTVRYRDGQPVKGVKVAAFEIEPAKAGKQGKEPASSPFASAVTREDGSYEIQPLPPGKYIVGVNGNKYEDLDPHPPSFYPEEATRQSASPIELATSAHRNAVDVVLAERRKPGTVRITVLFEDGKPVSGAGCKLLDRNGTDRAYSKDKADANGEADLAAYQGEEYGVEAWFFTSREEAVPMPDGNVGYRSHTTWYEGTTGPVRLDKPEIRVHVVLHARPNPSIR